MNRSGRLPTFVGVGAAKSGTTSLYRYLEQHPDIFMSRIKEPNYFAADIDPAGFSPLFKRADRQRWLDIEQYVEGNQTEEHWDAYVRTLDHYRKLFKFADDAIAVGEISNSYLFSRVSAERISSTIPDARIVMILRNPVDRAYSHYLANWRDGITIRSFRDEIEHDQGQPRKGWGISHLYVELGLYHEQVARYVNRFEADRLKVLIYDDFARRPADVVAEVFDFLGVSASCPVDVRSRHNAARVPAFPGLVHRMTQVGLKRPVFRLVPRRLRPAVKRLFFQRGDVPPLSTDDRRLLAGWYREDVARLSSLLGRDLSHWVSA